MSNIQDSTFITRKIVKFLVKSPIVGIKVFDGDTLKKRLQLTFESEGHYNIFVNKIRQWLGVDVEKAAAPPSQIVPHYTSSQAVGSSQARGSQVLVPQAEIGSSQAAVLSQVVGSSQVAGLSQAAILTQLGAPSQIVQSSQLQVANSQDVTGQHTVSQVLPLQQNANVVNLSCLTPATSLQPTGVFGQNVLQKPPKLNAAIFENLGQNLTAPPNTLQTLQGNDTLTYQSFFNPVSLLAGAAEMVEENTSGLPQEATDFLNSTQVGFNSTLQTSLLSGQYQVKTMPKEEKPTITGEDIYKALNGIPIGTKSKGRRLRRIRSRTLNNEKIQAAMSKIIEDVACSKDDSLSNLSDEKLALKVSRILKTKSFARLLKRVETLLQSLPDDHQDEE